jgi:3-dehydroquinate synthetase
MMGAARIAQRLKMIPEALVDRQSKLLERFNLPLHAKGVSADDIWRAMSLDKKTLGGAIQWVLLNDIGKAVVRNDVSMELVDEVIRELVR